VDYIPKAIPVRAMRVEPPYKAITEWCGWEPVKHGPKIAFLAEPRTGNRAHPGDYIVEQPDGAFAVRLADFFEKHYEKKED